MVKHKKLKYVKEFRKIMDYYPLKLPLPRINPNIISGLSIITALLFILSLKYSKFLAFILIIVTLLFDWFDGLIAKKHNLGSEKGYIVDVAADRISEGIMFIPFFVPWFYLFTLNCFLTLFSFIKYKHIIMNLRIVFMVYFLLTYII